jgi:hypothetical protein
MLLVQWLFQTLITPSSEGSARLAYSMHGSLVAVAGAVGVGVISWYLKQIRKDRVVPIVSPTGWSIMRAVTSPCRPHPGHDTCLFGAPPPKALAVQPATRPGPTLPGRFRHCDALEANCSVAQ